jgi:hypothetical protein
MLAGGGAVNGRLGHTHTHTQPRQQCPATHADTRTPAHTRAHLHECGVRGVCCAEHDGPGEALGRAPEGQPRGRDGVLGERERQLRDAVVEVVLRAGRRACAIVCAGACGVVVAAVVFVCVPGAVGRQRGKRVWPECVVGSARGTCVWLQCRSANQADASTPAAHTHTHARTATHGCTQQPRTWNLRRAHAMQSSKEATLSAASTSTTLASCSRAAASADARTASVLAAVLCVCVCVCVCVLGGGVGLCECVCMCVWVLLW